MNSIAKTLFSSFTFVVLIGFFLLRLPIMIQDGIEINYIDTLFTAVSATCLTGLTVLNIGDTFTLQGQIVLLLLIQFGGLSVLTFANYFIRNIASKTDQSINTLFKEILIFTLASELIGAFGLFAVWDHSMFISMNERIYYSIFHSISAFCNAGFSLFDDSIIGINIYSQMVLISIIVIGSFGFSGIREIVHPKAVRERINNPKQLLHVNTRISINTMVVISFVGAASFYVMDMYDASDKMFDKIVWSLFQAVTARSAGFNAVDLNTLSIGSIGLLMLLMFVGASSGSTGGGVKSSTIAVLMLRLKAKLTRKLSSKWISSDLLLKKALLLTKVTIASIAVGTALLYFTEADFSIKQLLFEQVSAITTTGLSLDITSQLSSLGKCIVMLSIFFGRTVLLKIAFTSNEAASKSDNEIFIG
jgi:Trk-type K+ transport system membrane component